MKNTMLAALTAAFGNCRMTANEDTPFCVKTGWIKEITGVNNTCDEGTFLVGVDSQGNKFEIAFNDDNVVDTRLKDAANDLEILNREAQVTDEDLRDEIIEVKNLIEQLKAEV